MHFSALAGIAFPSSHRGLYIARIKIQGVAAATKFFGRDDRRARPTEGIVDTIALDRVISDRDFEQTHGFLSAVACDGILRRACAAHRIQIRHLPDRCLCAVTTPVARRPFLDRVPRGLVLPVILAPAHGEVLLGPYDLAPNAERCRFEACGDSACLQGGRPRGRGDRHVGDPPRRSIVCRRLRRLPTADHLGRASRPHRRVRHRGHRQLRGGTRARGPASRAPGARSEPGRPAHTSNRREVRHRGCRDRRAVGPGWPIDRHPEDRGRGGRDDAPPQGRAPDGGQSPHRGDDHAEADRRHRAARAARDPPPARRPGAPQTLPRMALRHDRYADRLGETYPPGARPSLVRRCQPVPRVARSVGFKLRNPVLPVRLRPLR